ncbi:TetR/AcrR family transcriptional regulator [Dermatobacter hominis]|uniref:TetR/AcrR family transcriptional regulator n=1 Tax=Dermatobacter hominis TaxID=2884263 RepID=UPI001D0FF7A1|nr:TetR family transcriptional regulator [Dermatobacter hominis]UDY37579.1 TetR/AcrR family transcriptional regulator [Dermatobacter hominis]
MRDEQALATRRRIRDAAADLFLRDGYVATSMASIATAAGVSRPTVFNTFGSKAELLREIADVRLAGDDEPVDVLSRPLGRAMLEATDPQEVLELHAQLGAELLGRIVPILTVVAEAATTDPDAAALLEVQERGRLFGMGATVDRLIELGALREGLTREQAAASLWMLSGLEPYRLAERSGWSIEDYRDWYLRCARAALLGP